jgi:hypothetical protein
VPSVKEAQNGYSSERWSLELPSSADSSVFAAKRETDQSRIMGFQRFTS